MNRFMILESILIGAAIIAGGSLLAVFWNDIVSWLKRGISKVKQMIKIGVYGTKVFIRAGSKATVEEISRHFSKDHNNRWHETVVTREVPANKVPADIRKRAKYGREVDITSELELQLK